MGVPGLGILTLIIRMPEDDEMEVCFVLSVPCASLFVDSPHIWAGGEMLKISIFSIIIFFFSFLALVCGICACWLW